MKDVIERIRKILTKTEERGCTQAEAETAFRLASRLMAEHNLSMSEVEASDGESEPWTEDGTAVGGKWTMECNLAYHIVERFFFVEGYIMGRHEQGKRSKKIRFFGKQSNVETAKWAFSALLDAFGRLFREHRSRTKCPATDRRAFAAGVARGFSDKIQEERETVQDEQDVIRGRTTGGTELAIISIKQEVKRAFKQAHPKMGTSSTSFSGIRDSGGARQAGYAAGRSLNLARPIGQSRSKGLPA